VSGRSIYTIGHYVTYMESQITSAERLKPKALVGALFGEARAGISAAVLELDGCRVGVRWDEGVEG